MDKESVWGCMCVVGEVKEGLFGNRGEIRASRQSNHQVRIFEGLREVP